MGKGVEQIAQMLNAPGIKRQMLHECLIEAEYKSRQKFTEITFGTKCCDVMDAMEARSVVGIILWVPREDFDKAVKS